MRQPWRRSVREGLTKSATESVARIVAVVGG